MNISRKIVKTALLAAVACAFVATDASARRTFNSTRKQHSPDAKPAASIPAVRYDTIAAPARDAVVVSGYDKAHQSGKESFFITNNTGRHLRSIGLDIVYKDMKGQELHRSSQPVVCDIPVGETRHISRPSWDRQRSFYYHKNPPSRPRTVATPYDVSATVTYAVTDHAAQELPVITPMPRTMTAVEGTPLVASSGMTVVIEEPTLLGVMEPMLKTTYIGKYDVGASPAKGKPTIAMFLSPEVEGQEAYTLDIDATGARIVASTEKGLYYGAVTLGELLRQSDTIAPLHVADAPAMSYRGIMLDVSRHFHGFDFVKRQIDAMARLKLNTLHLHLTDAAGWRMEIEKYPLLTELAAWRPDSLWEDWSDHGAKYCRRNAPGAYGGYFTKAQLRELVNYAAKRGITIVPEIEMPGHSAEVVRVYPELSCTGNTETAEDFCPGKEATFTFLEGVLGEVLEVFPSKRIHIGGDEAAKKDWHTCPDCSTRMAAEGLKSVDELQSYLVSRIERYLNDHGRTLVGWDEIMEGGTAPNAVVMAWRGLARGMQAAADGHEVVMTPGDYCYFDSYQDAPHTQPKAFGGYLPLEKVYSYVPVPDTLDVEVAGKINGVQANLWCEMIPTESHAEYMLYPRAIALAEVGWTPADKRSWPDFRRRAHIFNESLRADGYNVFDLSKEFGNRKEALEPIRHLAVGKPVAYAMEWHRAYPAGGAGALVDGVRGGWNYSDKLWQGFERTDTKERIDVTIDLGESQPVSSVAADFMQITTPDVWLPERVEIYAGDTPENMKLLKAIDNATDDAGGKTVFRNFGWQGKTKARYVRYRALAPRGFLFTDEIVVQ